jgi:hypothetical protein
MEMERDVEVRAGERTTVEFDFSAPESAEVRVNGTAVGRYFFFNLFSKWGNGDGDDGFLVALAREVMVAVESEGVHITGTGWGIHNCAGIFEAEVDGETWENEFGEEELWEPEVYRRLWDALPEKLKTGLRKVAEKGIDLTL